MTLRKQRVVKTKKKKVKTTKKNEDSWKQKLDTAIKQNESGLTTVSKSDKGQLSVSDPSAFPKGNPEIEARIIKAKEEKRWVEVDGFSEEWQRIALALINGLSSISKIFPDGGEIKQTGGVKKNSEGKDEPIDDAVMFMDSMDRQISRMASLKNYFDSHHLEIDGKTKEGLAEDFDKIFQKIEMCKRKDIPEVRDDLIKFMESAGFKLKTERLPIVGERYSFETEMIYIGKDL